MLLEIGIADAFGMPYEFSGLQIQNIVGYRKRKKQIIAIGRYGDDTQMSIAIAELMLSDKEWTNENLAHYFYNGFKRDKRTGYAGKFYQFLLDVKSSEEFLEKIIPLSEKSGAAMRSVPLGYLEIDDLVDKCFAQAKITHNTDKGIFSSLIVALSSHYFIHDKGLKKDLFDWLNSLTPYQISPNWYGFVGTSGFDCTIAALTAVMKHDNLKDILKECINFTGDVDTVAAIAIGIASQCKEIEQNLPERLYTDFETGPYGINYLKDLDLKLIEKYKK